MTKSSGHEEDRMVGHEEDRMVKKFMKKSKARGLKEYKKHDFLQFIVKRAMKREKIDINTPNHIDRKIKKKIDDMKKEEEKKMLIEERTRPMLVDRLRPLIKKEDGHFKDVVDVEEENFVLVSKDVDNDDYKKEVMNKKTAKNNNKGKKTCKLPVEPPNVAICKLMLEKINEIEGRNPIWLTSKIMTWSDQNSGLGRVYIPRCDELETYLRKKEMDISTVDGMHCRAVDQNGEMWDLVLKYYNYLKQYAFVGGWKDILRSFGLLRPREQPYEDVPGGKIELWCFRLPVKDLRVKDSKVKDLKLCFALRITRL